MMSNGVMLCCQNNSFFFSGSFATFKNLKDVTINNFELTDVEKSLLNLVIGPGYFFSLGPGC